MIPTTLRYSPLLLVSKRDRVEIKDVLPIRWRRTQELTSEMSLLSKYDTVTAGIPVKFCTVHDRLRPEVGSTKIIEAYGSKVENLSTIGVNVKSATNFRS